MSGLRGPRAMVPTHPQSPRMPHPPSRPESTFSRDEPRLPRELDFSRYPPEPMDTDFKRKYPADRFGEEAADDARVWKVYRDEALRDDHALMDGWNKTLDILLIFAGLFSAVATAFIVESCKLLQADYSEYIANALYISLTARNGSGALQLQPGDLRAPSDFQPNPQSFWINGLWLTSLALSLCVSLLCILAKQWIGEYNTRVTGPAQSIRYWVRRRALYYEGLQSWHFPAFISTLPVLLHIALFLFLAGVVIFLLPLSMIIALWLLAMSGSIFIFYAASVIAPLTYVACPSSTPLVHQLHILMQSSRSVAYILIRQVGTLLGAMERVLPSPWRQSLAASIGLHRDNVSALTVDHDLSISGGIDPKRPHETAFIASNADELDALALETMIVFSPSPDVTVVAIQAIGGIRPWAQTFQHIHRRRVSWTVSATLRNKLLTQNYSALGLADVARYIRSLVHLSRSAVSYSGFPHSQVDATLHDLRFHARKSSASYPFDMTPDVYDLPVLYALSGPGGRNLAVGSHEYSAVLRHIASPPSDYRCSVNTLHAVLYTPSLSVNLILHLFQDDRLSRFHGADFTALMRRVQEILAPYEVQLIAEVREKPKVACVELWSAILNRRDALRLTEADTAAALWGLLRFVKQHAKLRYAFPRSSTATYKIRYFTHLLKFCSSDFVRCREWSEQDLTPLVSLLERIGVDPTSAWLSPYWKAFIVMFNATPTSRSALLLSGNEHEKALWGFVHAVSVSCTNFSTRHLAFPSGEEVPPIPGSFLLLRRDTHVQLKGDTPASTWGRLHKRKLGDLSQLPFLCILNLLATQLCLVNRLPPRLRPREMTAILDEFFAIPAVRLMDYFALAATKADARVIFAHYAQCCAELSQTWWPSLRSALLNGSHRDDPAVVDYAGELDEKLRKCGPCHYCKYPWQPSGSLTGEFVS